MRAAPRSRQRLSPEFLPGSFPSRTVRRPFDEATFNIEAGPEGEGEFDEVGITHPLRPPRKWPIAMSSLSTSEKYGFAVLSLGVVGVNLLSGFALWLVVKTEP